MEHKYWNGTNYITGHQVVTQIKDLKAISADGIVGWYYFPGATDFNMSLDDFQEDMPSTPRTHTTPFLFIQRQQYSNSCC